MFFEETRPAACIDEPFAADFVSFRCSFQGNSVFVLAGANDSLTRGAIDLDLDAKGFRPRSEGRFELPSINLEAGHVHEIAGAAFRALCDFLVVGSTEEKAQAKFSDFVLHQVFEAQNLFEVVTGYFDRGLSHFVCCRLRRVGRLLDD